MFGIESFTNAYRYCASNCKPLVKEASDYLLAMTPIVNLIFLQYRCHQAPKHITSPEGQENIRHFFEVMKRCNGINIIAGFAGIFHAIYCIQKRTLGIAETSPLLIVGISQVLFASSTVAGLLLEYQKRNIFKMIENAEGAALQNAMGATSKKLTPFFAKWASVLSPQHRLWISRMFQDCISNDINVLETVPSSRAEYFSNIKLMESSIRPTIITNYRQKSACLSLLLCGTGDYQNARALINLTFENYLITETSVRIDPTIVKTNFFFGENYTIERSEEPTTQIEALRTILQGNTYEFQGIHWQLDCPRKKTKSSQTTDENN